MQVSSKSKGELFLEKRPLPLKPPRKNFRRQSGKTLHKLIKCFSDVDSNIGKHGGIIKDRKKLYKIAELAISVENW